jgi:hypothetical protein
MQKYKTGFLIALLAIIGLSACGKIAKCKKYVGEYSDRGNPVSIEYKDGNFTFNEGNVSIPCICNNDGQLAVAGLKGPVVIILSDSAGVKRFCFGEDSLHEDCIYERKP